MREKIASPRGEGSPLFKTNFLNNFLFVESEKRSTLSPTSFNPKNLKMNKFSRKIRKPIQVGYIKVGRTYTYILNGNNRVATNNNFNRRDLTAYR